MAGLLCLRYARACVYFSLSSVLPSCLTSSIRSTLRFIRYFVTLFVVHDSSPYTDRSSGSARSPRHNRFSDNERASHATGADCLLSTTETKALMMGLSPYRPDGRLTRCGAWIWCGCVAALRMLLHVGPNWRDDRGASSN